MLLKKRKKCKEDIFQNLFIDYYASLISFAQKIVINRSISEDIVQEVFVNIWEKYDNIDLIKNKSSYLYQAVKFKSLNYLRDNKKNVEYESTVINSKEKSIEEFLVEEEVVRLILNELENLSPKCKCVFELSLKGLKSCEIAEELNIAIETVKKHKQIARKQLRESINRILIQLYIIMN